MPYSGDFPHSSTTQQIAEQLPSWMKARDAKSLFQQFVNPFALQLDELTSQIERLLDNLFIGSARLEEVDWVSRGDIPFDPPKEGEAPQATLHIKEQSLSARRVYRLRRFLEADDPVFLIDGERDRVYVRPLADAIELEGRQIPLGPHHIWNPFDEIALLAGIRRRHLETNEELKKRILYAFRFLPTTDRKGISASLANFCSLWSEAEWDESEPEISLDKKPVLGHTIRINDIPVLSGQWDGSLLRPVIEPLDIKDPRELEGIIVQNGRAVLAPGRLRGTLTTGLLLSGNLAQWEKVTYSSQGKVKVDILPPYYFEDETITPAPVVSNAASGSSFPDEAPDLRMPVYLRISLRRDSLDEPAPFIEDLRLHYKHSTGFVTYLYGVEIDALHKEAFKRTLFDERLQPTPQMRRFVAELNQAIPVLWDYFRWDEAFWDIIEEGLVGLDVLPTRWDGSLEGLHERYHQAGIGFGPDLEPRKDLWSLSTYKGTYFQGPALEERYLYASPGEVTEQGPVDEIEVPGPEWGSPLSVVYKHNGKDVVLRQVSFLDDEFGVSIENKEVLKGSGKPYLIATYANLDLSQTTVSGGYQIDESAYQGDNIIPLASSVPEGEEVEVTYRVRDSFAVSASENGVLVKLWKPCEDVVITYEQGEWRTHPLSVDPLNSHWHRGFAFIAYKESDPASIRVRISPSSLLADGVSRAIVTADITDALDNPVHQAQTTITIAAWDANGNAAEDPGALEFAGAYENRHIWRYTAPQEVNLDTDVIITVKCEDVEQQASLKLKRWEEYES